jgi:hypothetical protein
MEARYKGPSIPLMAVATNGGTRELRYVQDLLGAAFNVDDLGFRADGLGGPGPRERRYFKMVTRGDMQSTLKEIGEL